MPQPPVTDAQQLAERLDELAAVLVALAHALRHECNQAPQQSPATKAGEDELVVAFAEQPASANHA